MKNTKQPVVRQGTIAITVTDNAGRLITGAVVDAKGVLKGDELVRVGIIETIPLKFVGDVGKIYMFKISKNGSEPFTYLEIPKHNSTVKLTVVL